MIDIGVHWCRTMRVRLDLQVAGYDKASALSKALQVLGFEKEADEIQKAIDDENDNTVMTKDHGYIYDPDDKYTEVRT